MNRTAQAQHVVIRMHGLGRTAHYLPVDCECRMPFDFFGDPKDAAIDPMPPACLRRDDMAAGRPGLPYPSPGWVRGGILRMRLLTLILL